VKSTELHALINRLQVYMCSAVRGVELLSHTLDRIICVDESEHLDSHLSMGKVKHVM